MDNVDLSYAIGLPPAEAVNYFRSKGYAFSWDWKDVYQEAHAKSFTVARAGRLDVLQTIRGAVQKSLVQGLSFNSFKRELEPRLKKLGWWGKQWIGDGDGVARLIELGSPRRLKTIYRANMQSSYMAGRYKQMMENIEDRPWWQYVAVMDKKTRPAHRALHNRVFRYDDPIWRYLYPPNGWNCRCRVRALSANDIRERGPKVDESGDDLSQVQAIVSRATGEMRQVSAYRTIDPLTGRPITMSPDPGWSYNPGMAWADWDAVKTAVSEKTGAVSRAVPGQKTWKDFQRPDTRDIPAEHLLPAPEILKAAKSADEAMDVMSKALGLDEIGTRLINTPVEKVAIRKDRIIHPLTKRDNQRERYANYILPTLQKPYEVYLTEYGDGYRTRYIGMYEGKHNLLVVVNINQDGSVVWNYMDAKGKKMNRHRVGELLYGK